MTAAARCRLCRCTDDRACDGGCSWVEANLCSSHGVAGELVIADAMTLEIRRIDRLGNGSVRIEASAPGETRARFLVRGKGLYRNDPTEPWGFMHFSSVCMLQQSAKPLPVSRITRASLAPRPVTR